MEEQFLVDKSALARFGKPDVRDVLQPWHRRGLLRLCGAVVIEVLYSAQSKSDADQVRRWLSGFGWLYMPDEVWDRALEVQAALIKAGSWRAVSLPDLVIAATAERHGVTVLHYDGDFDIIAAVTGQPTRWVVPRGTAD